MQLDQTHITVRERGFLDLLDLALCVIRVHAWQLLFTSLAGVLPLVALNVWLLADAREDLELEVMPETVWAYVWRLTYLMVAELPLAALPTTVYLGHALFVDRPAAGRIARDLWGSAGQLLLLVVGPRMFFAVLAVATRNELWIGLGTAGLLVVLFVYHFFCPYLAEVILLERNPLVRRTPGLTTLKRSGYLHLRWLGDLFGRMMLAGLFAGLWIVALWIALSYTATTVFTGDVDFATRDLTLYLPTAAWVVISIFGVVRFLSYLDLRIRSEGWEIELRMRAEAERLSRQVA